MKSALWHQQLIGITRDPPRQRKYRSRITDALDSSPVALNRWRKDVLCMAEAALFEIEDADGAERDWIYSELYDAPQGFHNRLDGGGRSRDFPNQHGGGE